MNKEIKERIKRTATRLIKLIELNAPDKVIQNEIDLLVMLSKMG
jgi:hypothetical protein